MTIKESPRILGIIDTTSRFARQFRFSLTFDRREANGFLSNIQENNRKARFYKLTAAGRKQLTDERSNWERLSTAINLVLRTT